MAIGWWTALKAVPWSDVIEAAPPLLKAARRYFARTQQPPGDPAAAAPLDAQADARAQDRERLGRIEAELTERAEQQRASAALVESLAEQHARVVQALAVLHARLRLLAGATALLAVALAALVAWLALH